MTDAIPNTLAMLRAIGDIAREKYIEAFGRDVASLNGAARSMEWLARHIETDDEANIVGVALQAALAVGQVLSPDQLLALRESFKPDTKQARKKRSEQVKKRRAVIKDYLVKYPPHCADNHVKLADSLLADPRFVDYVRGRKVKMVKKTTLIEDLKAIGFNG